MRQVMKLTASLALLLSAASWAIVPPEQSSLASKAFFKPELYIPVTNIPLAEAQPQLSSLSAGAWEDFFARNGKDFNVYLDPRTGAATSVQGTIPLIPGDGVGNRVSLASVRLSLGRAVNQVDGAVVGDLITKFIADNSAALGVDPMQLGEPRVTQVTDFLWMVHIPQQLNGVSVRHARVAAVINHGNLILLGTEAWARPQVDTRPAIAPEQALAFGGDYLGMYETPNNLWKQPELEIAPLARADSENGQTFTGTFGVGYEHRLVWSYGFQRPGEHERWEVTVDAQTGEVLAVEDKNHYLDAAIKGGIYPSTNTEICPNNETCGTLQPNSPMPWANTGLAAPNNFTDGAGIYDYTSGTATTTLAGKYVRITDNCGAVSFSSSANGAIDMGGVNGNHDCTTGGGGAGNTAAARSSFYELNKLAEQARGWLPSNTWLTSQLSSNVNIASTCNAFWNGSSVNFYRSGGGCRNTGEIGAVFDHEWGHGMDDFDANGTLSNSSEGYADIAAIYRLQTSCVGHGFFWTSDKGCGQTADGTGYNVNESQVTGSPHCATNCSGVRDADWARHSDNTPDTPQNHVCPRCSASTGPCGRQVHCAAAPARQAAWDLVSRDLRAAPFNYDSNTAFLVANKVFYQGSGNIGTWHACDCTAGTSNGCGATNGYMSWLAADDDNGNLNDGTPHMTAIYNAFNRHNIACATPAPVNAGCATGPSTAPAATVTPGDGQVNLSWSGVTNASSYWVMKTEGFAGCNFGKAKVATVTGTSYTDSEVANGRQYCYSIVAAGSSAACYGPGSTCVCTTPTCASPTTPALATPASGATGVEFAAVLDWNDVTGTTYDVQVASDSAFATVVASASGLSASTWTVSPALANATTTYYWRVRSTNSCGGSSAWSSARAFTTRGCTTLAAPTLSAPANGATGVAAATALDFSDVVGATGYEVQVASDPAFTTVVRTNTALAASAWTVSPALNANTTYYWRARTKDSCGVSAYSAASSFTTANICAPQVAAYDATLKVPSCTAACGCDTGTTAIKGRGTMLSGNETNRPNTLGGTCVDGNSGTYQTDESLEQLTIKTVDQGTLAPGKQVQLEVKAHCYSSTDKLDLYYSTNPTAATPTWTALATGLSCPATRGFYTFTHTFNLNATATGQQAIRGNFRFSSTAGSCTTGGYDDRDDLVFTVSTAVAQKQPGKAPTTQGRNTAGR
ncbi:PepSY domain-containing protein [Archangium sp.]|uniref:PepSY domain-containing protein n=1 Tax=Archangium sp. TaxID=1872627 RepID=UPI002D6994F2|nr:PepSY domain-containing protein [Archangium sp.]HYO54462.1 PepSY domain-containing protein [Archangium sp.]